MLNYDLIVIVCLIKSLVRPLYWELKKTWFWVWMALGSWQIAFQMLLIMNLTNWGMQLMLKADGSIKFY